jgi:hypothetical protein
MIKSVEPRELWCGRDEITGNVYCEGADTACRRSGAMSIDNLPMQVGLMRRLVTFSGVRN